MRQVYDEVRTPFKYGLVLAPQDNEHKIDCPTVFRDGKRWFMSYLVFDGRGYETWLATSDDLLQWRSLGKILSFGQDVWDAKQRGGYVGLIDIDWGGSYRAARYKGKHWLSYIGGATSGYEAGTLKVGLASTSKPIAKPGNWMTLDKPVLSPEDADNGWWESLTQYKSNIVWDKALHFGKPFVMFYNAGGVNPETKVKGERIGVALSDDMLHWKRFQGNPVLNHEGGITGDAWIQKMGDLYVLFYFSAFRPGNPNLSFNNFACSYDLKSWTDWTGDPLIVSSETYDAKFAHKSCVVKYRGVVYHFYCAVDEADHRGIAVATSKDLGVGQLRFPKAEPTLFRKTLDLSGSWFSRLDEPDAAWKQVRVPHNWDQYYGYRRLKHGNLHATAWYRKTFRAPAVGKRFFLFFEGVGSYATVYLNGDSVGAHRGGRTTFTIDVTAKLRPGKDNEVKVKAEHPAYSTDLPWVCGGCSNESGFSEGSQPLGIFRPVSLYVTDDVRVQPFGVHLWNTGDSLRTLFAETTVKNYGSKPVTVEVVNKLLARFDIQAARSANTVLLQAGEERVLKTTCTLSKEPTLWSPDSPYLYTMATMVKIDGKVVDEERTPYGFRTFHWPLKGGDRRFLVNGKPVFINGVCEYEHLNGNSHAFSDAEIQARVKQIRTAGFNAFREGHQPHNLRYGQAWDQTGILQWTQFSAHIWYDTPTFREAFKTLLKEWVVERRNSPSVMLWGLQNESMLPDGFAKECSDLIRTLDPTASDQRPITTCNGGTGTDWDVVQNWSGTYGGNPDNYGNELKRQLLNGEYGAVRTLGLHTEGGFVQKGLPSEDRMWQLLEKKIRLAEANKDSLCGQFLWLFQSHENPGRIQNDEGLRELDKLGPFNNKGLFTSWGEPVDAYYLYQSNYGKEPMVYIVSHTWSDRWSSAGLKDSLIVFSNCDSVELYNGSVSLGFRHRNGIGTHFQWDGVPVRWNNLKAIGYRDGRAVVRDEIKLDGLETTVADKQAPNLQRKHLTLKPVSTKSEKNFRYVYRVNCGGPAYTDVHGQLWSADCALADNDSACWGSRSWAQDFKGLHPFLGSQRITSDPIAGTPDATLFQTFRYGAGRLRYRFPVTPGNYRVELYFTEPWYGTGSNADAEGQRLFDVSVDGVTVLKDLDVWREAGHDGALKKTVDVETCGDELILEFPDVQAGQALISAIAIATKEKGVLPAKPGSLTMNSLVATSSGDEPEPRPDVRMEAETAVAAGAVDTLAVFGERRLAQVRKPGPIAFRWAVSPGLAGVYNLRFRYVNYADKPLEMTLQVVAADGRMLRNAVISFPPGSDKMKTLSTTTDVLINAGHYQVVLRSDDATGLGLDALIFQ
jgi:predicted GH43/DUF377 family glycosyl hydrolase